MVIKKTRCLSIRADLLNDISAVQALQMMFTSKLNNRSDLVPIQRSYYIKNLDRKNLGFNVDLWKGFFVSVRPLESGFNLNVDGKLPVIVFNKQQKRFPCFYLSGERGALQ